MPKGLEQSDYTNPEIWEYVNANDFENAFINSQDSDLKLVVTNWLSKYSNVDVNDDQIVDLVTNWYLFFKSSNDKENPFFAFLKYLKEKGIKPSYNDLVVINNKYQERILDDEDLKKRTINDVLNTSYFYGKPIDNQNYWLEIYAFLSDENEIRRIANGLNDNAKIKVGETIFTKENIGEKNKLRDVLLFGENYGDNKNKITNPSDVQFILNYIAQNMSDDATIKNKPTNNNNTTKKPRNRNFKNEYKLNQFLNDNASALKDNELLNDIQTWINDYFSQFE